MRITLEPTPSFFMAGEVMVRLWTGVTGEGRPINALIACVFNLGPAPEGLVEIPPPTAEEAQQWAKKILGQ